MQQIIEEGGLVVPNVVKYYQAPMLSSITSRLGQKELEDVCSLEQMNIPVVLTNWMLWGKEKPWDLL